MQGGGLRQCLREQGFAVVPVKGTSMLPLLREGESRVELVADGTPYRKGDVVLYERGDGTLVLHRITRLGPHDTCFLCGDHQIGPEEPVQSGQILAVARGFFRNGRYVDEGTGWYRLYKRVWSRPLIRRCCLAFLRLADNFRHSGDALGKL